MISKKNVTCIWILLFGISLSFGRQITNDKNLIKSCYFIASSFKGSNDRTVKTDSYYTNLQDGNANTFWRPMDKEDPHYIETYWRYPLTINKFSYKGTGLEKARLSVWHKNKWMPVGELSGKKQSITFPEKITRRLRLDIEKSNGKLQLSELEAYGPEQPIPPKTLPREVISNDKIDIHDITVSPKNNCKNSFVEISFKVSVSEPLSTDYYYLIDIKDSGALSAWLGDFEVASAVGVTDLNSSAWQPGKKYPVSVKLFLPDYTPPGKTDIKIAAVDFDGKQKAMLSTTELGTIDAKDISTKVSRENYPAAKLEFNNGQFGFQIGKEFYLPFFMRYIKATDFERFYHNKDSGIELQYFLMYDRCIGRSSPSQQEFFDRLDMNIRNLLRVRPNCYIMVGIDLGASPTWLRANPKELMIDAFGRKPADIPNEPGIVSFGSQKYEDDCKDFLSSLMDFLATKPYAGRIVGWHPYIYTQLDSFIGGVSKNMMKKRHEISIVDFHPGAIKKYQNWLQKKYHNSVDELRKAWKNDEITFATARPKIKELVKEGDDGGIFRNPQVCQAAYDYLEFFPSLLGSFNRRIAKFIKEKTDNKALVMIHYGAVTVSLCNAQPSGSRAHVNNFDLPEMLKDSNIDMYVQASKYESRHSGQPYIIYPPVDSLTLHNRMFLADNDSRTFSAGTLQHGRHRGAKETSAVIMRDMAWHLLKNTGAWFADMSYDRPNKWSGERYPWFARPAVTKSMRQIMDVFGKVLGKKHVSASEIAVFISTSTPRYEDIYHAAPLYHNLIQRMLFEEINILGAPYDIYMMSDLASPKIKKDYKLYIFLNPFFMNKEERVAVGKLKNDGKTLLWFYAPGYINKDRGLITEGISEITGMKIYKKSGKEKPCMRISRINHPITQKITGREYISKGFNDNYWSKMHSSEYGPIFYIDDPKTLSLGYYPDKKTAFAVRKFKKWNSIYCAVPFLDAQAIRNIANFAGVHLYCHENVVMAADNRFLMFNNGYEKEKTIRVFMPSKRKVIDALSGEIISSGIETFELKMNAPQTKILRLY